MTLDTAGLGDDALHVLDLSLAAAEGAELERMLAFVTDMFRCPCLLSGGSEELEDGGSEKKCSTVNTPMSHSKVDATQT